jgi:GH35 family endo-1,4-beta-xylanase
MKWQVVEPQPGVFGWSGADRLVNFAEHNGQLVRGHTLYDVNLSPKPAFFALQQDLQLAAFGAPHRSSIRRHR